MLILLSLLSCLLALVFGISFWKAYSDHRQQSRYKQKLLSESSILYSKGEEKKLEGDSALRLRVYEMMRNASYEMALKDIENGKVPERKAREHEPSLSGTPIVGAAFRSKWFCANHEKAGVGNEITERGFCLVRIRACAAAALMAAVLGAMLSTELCVLMLLVGAIVGWRLPKSTLMHRIENRTYQMEHHLPEMLDVLALGMRSGMSFDSSIKLYTTHFKTYLSSEFANAQRQWQSGLEYRDEGLRKIASSYDSQIFRRVIETIIRSVRFGSSMVESLEEQSAEARLAYRTRREEQVAKAPVKMMIPTGTLILPAMLIMVVGPVLLELMGGGL